MSLCSAEMWPRVKGFGAISTRCCRAVSGALQSRYGISGHPRTTWVLDFSEILRVRFAPRADGGVARSGTGARGGIPVLLDELGYEPRTMGLVALRFVLGERYASRALSAEPVVSWSDS